METDLHITDAEQFMAMKDMYMKNGQGFLLVYSITSSASLQEVIELREQLVRVKDSDKVSSDAPKRSIDAYTGGSIDSISACRKQV
jgi:hypothetical protein